MVYLLTVAQPSGESGIDIYFQRSDDRFGEYQIQRRHTRVCGENQDAVLPGQIV